MKRPADFDEFKQAKPVNKKMVDPLSGYIYPTGIQYVTQEEFIKMQKDLADKLAEQTTIQEQLLLELKQVKLHLAAMSNEPIDEESVRE